MRQEKLGNTRHIVIFRIRLIVSSKNWERKDPAHPKHGFQFGRGKLCRSMSKQSFRLEVTGRGASKVNTFHLFSFSERHSDSTTKVCLVTFCWDDKRESVITNEDVGSCMSSRTSIYDTLSSLIISLKRAVRPSRTGLRIAKTWTTLTSHAHMVMFGTAQLASKCGPTSNPPGRPRPECRPQVYLSSIPDQGQRA